MIGNAARRERRARAANSPAREQNLFGEKYSAATLKALGIATAKPKTTAKKKKTSKGKKK